MIDTVYKCDVCNAVRGPENHWLMVYSRRDFEVLPWSDETANDERNQHICGAACAHVVLDRYLESLRKESENVPSV